MQADISVEEVPGDTWDRTHFISQTPEAFTYDADGNLTSDGIWDYGWDAENRLTVMHMKEEIAEVRVGTGNEWIRLEFAYDYLGRRISKRYRKAEGYGSMEEVQKGSVTILWNQGYWQKFLYDGWMLSASYQCDEEGGFQSVDQSYAWGPDLSSGYGGAGGIGGLAIYTDDLADSDGGTYIGPMYPAYDGNGNLTRMYRLGAAVGNVPDMTPAAQYEYGPFGELLGVSGTQGQRQPFRFSTKYTDAETGLVYYGYRYYSPSMGRWCTRDPIEEEGGLNVYGFVGGAPTYGADPLGLWTRTNWSGMWGKYSGAATAECGDTYDGLASMITGNSSDSYLVGTGTPTPGTVVNVSKLLAVFEQRTRAATVLAARSFTAGFDTHLPPPGWTPSVVNRYFNNGSGVSVDCGGAARLILTKGVIDSLGMPLFETLFGGNAIPTVTSDIASESDLRAGDWTIIKNDDRYSNWYARKYRAEHPRDPSNPNPQPDDYGAWSQENAIYMGHGLFWGHGADDVGFATKEFTEAAMIDAMTKDLMAIAPPNVDKFMIPGRLPRTRFVDIAHIAKKRFDYLQRLAKLEKRGLRRGPLAY